MTLGCAAKLGFIPRPINVSDQKIDGSTLETYIIALARFLLKDSFGRVRFFEETLLLADISIKVVLRMPFQSLSNVDFQFDAVELTWRSYTVTEAFSTAQRIELIDKHKFATAALGENSKTIIVHFAALEAQVLAMSIHSSQPLLLAPLQQNKTFTKIFSESSDYTDVLYLIWQWSCPRKLVSTSMPLS